MADDPDDLQPSGPTRRSRWEIKVIFALVLGVIVIGALWSALLGSPARRRAVMDSPNTNPYRVQTAPPTH